MVMDGEADLVLDTSVNYKGNVPLRSKTGSWKAALFIIGIEFSERLCYFGLATNLIIYLTKVLHQEVETAAKNVNYWTGVTTIMPLLGGFIADSYLGKFNTVLLSSAIYLLGLGMLTMTQLIPSLKPNQGTHNHHELLFFLSLYLISIATGGHKPALESFGADQFDGDHPTERKQKMSYFNWWNAALSSGLVLGVTVVVYVQDYVGWDVADIGLTIVMGSGLVVFWMGRRRYRYRVPEGSPLTPLARVAVAVFVKRKVRVPEDPKELYDVPGKKTLSHTHKLRFLDKAAVLESTTTTTTNPWRLATVNEVEQLKLLISILPVWLSTQVFGICVAQAPTFFIKQSAAMDRSLPNTTFVLPPASLFAFCAVTLVVSVALYDTLLVPLLRRATGNDRGIGILKRIGVGMGFSVLALAVAAVVENKRLGLVAGGRGPMTMSAFWLVPQFAVLGIGDGFALVGLQEYFYEQVPESMRSLGIAFYLSVIGSANFLSSGLITLVGKVTRRGGSKTGWFGKDLNGSRLDCFYGLLAILGALNLCVFVLVATKCSICMGGVDSNKKKKKVSSEEHGSPNELECC